MVLLRGISDYPLPRGTAAVAAWDPSIGRAETLPQATNNMGTLKDVCALLDSRWDFLKLEILNANQLIARSS